MPGRALLGQNTVELALAMGLMLTVLLGMIDFGRAFYVQVGLTNAAREGARCATLGQSGTLCDNVPNCNASNIQAWVRAEQPFLDIPVSTIGVDCSQADRRSVSITNYLLPLANPFLDPLVGDGSGNLRLSTWATMPYTSPSP